MEQEQATRTTRLLTIHEVMERLRLSEAKTRRLVVRGDIRSVKIDASRRVPEDAIDEYIATLVAEEAARRAGSAA